MFLVLSCQIKLYQPTIDLRWLCNSVPMCWLDSLALQCPHPWVDCPPPSPPFTDCCTHRLAPDRTKMPWQGLLAHRSVVSNTISSICSHAVNILMTKTAWLSTALDEQKCVLELVTIVIKSSLFLTLFLFCWPTSQNIIYSHYNFGKYLLKHMYPLLVLAKYSISELHDQGQQ